MLTDNKRLKIVALLASILTIIGLTASSPALAEYFLYLKPIAFDGQKAFTLESPDGLVKISIPAGTSTDGGAIKFMNLLEQDKIKESFSHGDNLEPASDLYFINLSSLAAFDTSSLPTVTVKFEASNFNRQIYYYNWSNLSFEKITDIKKDTKGNSITFNLAGDNLLFAAFNETESVGTASWYVHPRYPKELMAASTDYGFNAKVKVINLDNNKEVTVTIKDFGPDKSVHPDRVIDLSKEAFKKLAPTSAGVISVKVIPVE